jgi:hypothetical protein
MYIMAPEPIPMAYFINPSHQSVCLFMYTFIVARQQLDILVPAVTNTRNKEESLDASFSVRSVYQRKICN